MSEVDAHRRLLGLSRPLGPECRRLTVGDWEISLEGLDAALARRLEERWGPFLGTGRAEGRAAVRVVDGSDARWLGRPAPAERYRLEARGGPARRVIVSHHFALAAEAGEGRRYRLALGPEAGEPRERMVENAARVVLAAEALRSGGFALHGAGVLARDRAYLFVGPSGAGKSTAVSRSAPAESLGDDFALVAPREGSWFAAAVPFDNAERIAPGARRGWFEVAGIWRLRRASATRFEYPPPARAAVSLMGAVAFPWVFPEQAGRLLDHVRRFVAERRFGHLFFPLGADLWTELIEGDPGGRVDFSGREP